MMFPVHDSRSSPSVAPTKAARAPKPYGAAATTLGVGMFTAGAVLVGSAAGWEAPGLVRSVLLGVGLVALSAGATVIVSLVMYRVAPAATAPALAALYLLKVVAMGWFLINVGAPSWLHPRGFAASAALTLVASWLGMGPVAGRAARILGEDQLRVIRADQDAAPESAAEPSGRNRQVNGNALRKDTCDQA